MAHPAVRSRTGWTRACADGRVLPGYLADHWCEKGHILLVLAGQLDTELADGRTFTLRPGESYQVADHAEAHRSSTEVGATLFIVD